MEVFLEAGAVEDGGEEEVKTVEVDEGWLPLGVDEDVGGLEVAVDGAKRAPGVPNVGEGDGGCV